MSPKPGDRAAPPPFDQEYDIRFANTEAADGWEHLGRQAANNLRRAFEKIRANPRARDRPDRQHRLRGNLGAAAFKGLLDDATHTAWITYAGTGHPKATD